MCRFHVNGVPIRHIFHRFQILPVSCERSLSRKRKIYESSTLNFAGLASFFLVNKSIFK